MSPFRSTDVIAKLSPVGRDDLKCFLFRGENTFELAVLIKKIDPSSRTSVLDQRIFVTNFTAVEAKKRIVSTPSGEKTLLNNPSFGRH